MSSAILTSNGKITCGFSFYPPIKNSKSKTSETVESIIFNVNKPSSCSNNIDLCKIISNGKIKAISKLEKNWNGNGADRFSKKLIKLSYKIIDNLETQPNIFPTARDSIQLEYENSSKDYLEFEIFEDKIKMFSCKNDGSEETTKYIDSSQLNNIISKFYEQQIWW